MKFLEREELANYNFQNEFLRRFVLCMLRVCVFVFCKSCMFMFVCSVCFMCCVCCVCVVCVLFMLSVCVVCVI
ncbi:unnamed protein product, partial [Musa acuminata subsp. burmannicoides]